ncbi:beta-lactamase OS=Ureibacillus acetophenoni OX=614649 GN=SAMN05877842_102379 PE=3 SV=1 [Ureibacillus acetophenoni]
MNQKIRPLLEDVDFKVHLFVKDLKSDQFLIDDKLDEIFSSASLIKVPILLGVLDYVQKNNLPLDYEIAIDTENKVDFSVVTEQDLTSCTLYELLVWMIITSDNSATNVLIDFLGMDELNKYFNQIGLLSTKLQRKMMDFERANRGFDNVTTARDMAHLYSRIYQQNLLSEQYSNLVIDILCRQRVHEGLKRYIADDVSIAHKTGSLDTVCHDVGIVYLDQSDYIIGVFLTELNDVEAGKRLIGRISKMVYENIGLPEGRSSIESNRK